MKMFSKLFGFDDIGIELGAANMRVWVKGEGVVLDEPAAVTLEVPVEVEEPSAAEHQKQQNFDRRVKHRVLAIGAAAGAQIGKTPGNLIVVRPFMGGIICDFDIATKVLSYCFSKVKRGKFRKPRVVIAVPCGIAEVEKRALEAAARSAGAREVWLVESIMVAAIGTGLPISEPKGCMVMDIGASKTEIADISLAGIVHAKGLHVGGDKMDKAIVTYLHDKYNLVIGDREAEDIKIKIGTAFKPETELDYKIEGLDATESRRLAVTINSREIREEALAETLGQIDGVLKDIIVHTEPELVADIVDSGLVLTGGGALLSGLDKRLADATGLPVRMADNPAQATILGVSVVINELDFLSKNATKR